VTGKRLVVGAVVMGVVVPLVLFFLLGLQTLPQLFTIAATTFLTWGMADLLASILERPRGEKRSTREALQEWERHKTGVTSSHSASAEADRS